jgi:hypothetical protein
MGTEGWIADQLFVVFKFLSGREGWGFWGLNCGLLAGENGAMGVRCQPQDLKSCTWEREV